MKTRKIAGIVLAITPLVSGKLARYFATVENPMAKSAPMTLRTVLSSCWARFSWMANMSSLIVMTRNAYGPPSVEKGRIATTRQHNRVESILAIACLLASPVLTRAVLRVDKESMRYHGERDVLASFAFLRTLRKYLWWHSDKRQVTRAADRTLGLALRYRSTSAVSLVLTLGLSPLPPPHLHSLFVRRGQRATTHATTAPSVSSPKLDPTRPDDESISRGRPSHDGPALIDAHSDKLSTSTVSSLVHSGNDGI